MLRCTLPWVLALVACSATDSSSGDTEDTGSSSTDGGSATDPSAGSDPSSSDTATGTATATATASATATTGDPTDDTGTAEGSSTGDEPGTTGGVEPTGDPREPGPHPWSMSSHELELDGTTIPLTLYIPDEDGPHPVVVLTHGFQLSPGDYASYGEHLASWGYVAVLPQFPGSLINPSTHAELRDWMVGILDWIDAVGDDPAAPLQGRADTSAVALAGHSMGGKISFLTATSDARPQAVFGIDPVDAAGGPGQSPGPDYPSVTPELMPLIVVPFAVVGETTNATGGLGGACAPAEDNFEQYFMHAESPALKIEVLGANHMSFLDDPNCGLTCSVCTAGTDDPAVTRSLTQGYLIAFLGVTLREQAAWSTYLTGDEIQVDVDAGLVEFETANGF